MQTRTNRCASADRPKQRPWPPPARLVRQHRPLEVGDNARAIWIEAHKNDLESVHEVAPQAEFRRRVVGGPTLAVVAARVWQKHVSCGVTAATALDLRSTDDYGRAERARGPPARNKIEHSRGLIVFGLLGHRGVVNTGDFGLRSRHCCRSLETTNNCCEHAS